VVADQIGRATSAKDLASGIIVLTTTGAEFGTHNITNSDDPASWVDVATTFELAARSQHDVADTTTAAYFAARSDAARRPLNSVLRLRKADAGVYLPP